MICYAGRISFLLAALVRNDIVFLVLYPDNPLICLILVQLLKKSHKIPRHGLPQRRMGYEIKPVVRYGQDDEGDDIGAAVVAFDPIVNDKADEDEVGY